MKATNEDGAKAVTRFTKEGLITVCVTQRQAGDLVHSEVQTMDTRELHIRNSLVALGWSPPGEARPAGIPRVGDPWPEQGGVYVGSRIIDGVQHHRIMPTGSECERMVCYDLARRKEVDFGHIDGFADWKVGTHEDLLLAWISARHAFLKPPPENIYWSSSFSSPLATTLKPEAPNYCYCPPDCKFRVRPFRSAT